MRVVYNCQQLRGPSLLALNGEPLTNRSSFRNMAAERKWQLTRTFAENMTTFCEHQSRSIDLRKRCDDIRATLTDLQQTLRATSSEEKEERAMAASVLKQILDQGGVLQAHLSDTTFETSTEPREQLEEIASQLRQKLLTGAAKSAAPTSRLDMELDDKHAHEPPPMDSIKKRRRDAGEELTVTYLDRSVQEPGEIDNDLLWGSGSYWHASEDDTRDEECPYFNHRGGCMRKARDCWRSHRCALCGSSRHGRYLCSR